MTKGVSPLMLSLEQKLGKGPTASSWNYRLQNFQINIIEAGQLLWILTQNGKE
jgi:hypothetical protein